MGYICVLYKCILCFIFCSHLFYVCVHNYDQYTHRKHETVAPDKTTADLEAVHFTYPSERDHIFCYQLIEVFGIRNLSDDDAVLSLWRSWGAAIQRQRLISFWDHF